MRSFITDILMFFFSVFAGEDAVDATDDGEDMFGGKDDEGGDAEDEEDGGDETDDSDSDSDDSDDEDDDEEEEEEDDDDDDDAESEDDDADSEGDGGEEGVDPTVAINLHRTWEARLENAAQQRMQDPLATLKAANVQIPDELRDKAKQLFEEEKDIEAIVEVLKTVAPTLFSAYDESRVAPLMDAAEITTRTQRIKADVEKFDDEYPDVRTSEMNERMAAEYNKYAQKHGWRAADQIPPEDYFLMAGGRLPRTKVTTKKSKKKSGRKERAEKSKRRSLATTRTPQRVSRSSTKKRRKARKGSEEADAQDTFQTVTRTRFDPFNM